MTLTATFKKSLWLAAFVALASCDNPADKTTDAQVGAARDASDPAGSVGAVKYVFTEDSTIEFTGSKATGSFHDGGFKTFSGYFHVKDGKPVGTDHQVIIDMNSIWSDSEKLTGHLKNEDFFEVETYPETVFDNIEIKEDGDETYLVTGNLNMHGVTKSVSFPATVTREGDALKIEAEFDIDRKEWGIVYGSTGPADRLIRDEVVLRFKLLARPEEA